jgi:hypothetical protein
MRARLFWRIALLVYALALTIGTHWPRLRLGTEAMGSPDKLLHFVAFGVLAFLLWRSGWLRGGWALLAIALLWVLADELSQAIPSLGRSVSWMDALAGAGGVLVVAAWRWALRRVGGPGNRARLAFLDATADEVVTRPVVWIIAALAAIPAAAALGAFTLLLWLRPRLDDVILAALAGGGAALHFVIVARLRAHRDAAARRRPCLACGESCATASFDAAALARCPACAAPQWAGQWRARLGLSRRRFGREVLLPSIRPILLLAPFAIVAIAAATTLRELTSAMVLTIGGLMAADAVAVARVRVAAIVDAQHRRCLGCGHDLHASPTTHGEGHCGECGAVYHVPPA